MLQQRMVEVQEEKEEGLQEEVVDHQFSITMENQAMSIYTAPNQG